MKPSLGDVVAALIWWGCVALAATLLVWFFLGDPR